MASESVPLGESSVSEGWSQTVEVTVGSLANAGNEPWDPDANTALAGAETVQVIGQTDPAYRITWNHAEQRFDVKEVQDTGDGTGGLVDVAAGTAIGSIKVRVTGVR